MTRLLPLLIILFIAAPLAPQPAFSQGASENERRAQELYYEVRCPVCGGQSVAGSDVSVARSIRDYINNSIEAGDSNETIKANLADRYGNDILFEPVVNAATLPLWLLPWVILLVFAGGIWFLTRRKTQDT